MNENIDFYMDFSDAFYNYHKTINIDAGCGVDLENEQKKLNILPSLIDLHSLNNGFQITWQAKKIENLFGGLNFLPIEEVYENQEGNLFFKEDVEHSPLLPYFRPFDEISPEIRCGFIDCPDEEIADIYLLSQSDLTGLQSLDINFEGYLELMKMCWVYNNWPLILIYIQDNNQEKLNSDLVNIFKNDMPKIFKDFSWEAFVKKYESLRLSKA